MFVDIIFRSRLGSMNSRWKGGMRKKKVRMEELMDGCLGEVEGLGVMGWRGGRRRLNE